ncbi:MAG: hypothetical protein QNK37_26665 [Acidobacteriota bacterium]|nr:hypothetical protein [Acidobacteriota bacterium]
MPVRFIISLLLCLTLPVGAGEISGVIEDGTNGGNGKAAVVNLIRPARGMEVVASLNNVEGPFTLKFDGELGQGTILLQAIKDGVFYTQARVNPDGINKVKVYDADPEAKVVTQMGYIGIYAYADRVELMTFFYLDNINSPPKTRFGGEPAVTFRVPPGYKELEGSIQRGTMPLRQGIQVENGVGTATFALKPGRTTFVVRASFEQTDQLTIPLLEDMTEGKLVILPTSMQAEGPGLTFIEQDPQNGMNIYTFAVNEGQKDLVVNLSGTPDEQRGQVNNRGGSEGSSSSTAAHENPVKNTPNRLDRFRYMIMGSILALLALVSILVWRR